MYQWVDNPHPSTLSNLVPKPLLVEDGCGGVYVGPATEQTTLFAMAFLHHLYSKTSASCLQSYNDKVGNDWEIKHHTDWFVLRLMYPYKGPNVARSFYLRSVVTSDGFALD
eukprot:6170140-Ditylum_brightwellii.AAC.1